MNMKTQGPLETIPYFNCQLINENVFTFSKRFFKYCCLSGYMSLYNAFARAFFLGLYVTKTCNWIYINYTVKKGSRVSRLQPGYH